MTKAEQVIAAVIEKITGVGGLEDVYDSTVREKARSKTAYAVVSEGDESANTPPGQKITPLDMRTQIVVGLVVKGGDTADVHMVSEINFAAIKRLRAVQEAVEGMLLKSNITFAGLVRQFIYTGARNIPDATGEQLSFVREMRFDAVWDYHLPDEA